MPTAITGSEGEKLNYLPNDMEARKILANLKAQITGQNGVVKPGVLKLMHTTPGSPGNMTFERKRWWQFWARRDSKMATTADYLKTLLRQAYGENKNYKNDEKFESLMSDFERYLEQRNNRAGTRTVNDFITRFEREFPENYEKLHLPPEQDPTTPRFEREFPENYERFYLPPDQDLTTPWKDKLKKTLTADLDVFFLKKAKDPTRLLGRLEKTSDQRSESERLTSNICNAIALPDDRDPEVKPLGSGNFGKAYSFIDEDGKHRVIKLMFSEVECVVGPEASVRAEDVCAARLKAERHIIQPDFYLIKREGGAIFKLPPEAVKGFLRAQKHNCNTIGLIMPMCSGTDLNDKSRTISHSEMKAIAKQALESLTSLADRGFIHGNIKLENILFDSEKREMNLIDTGFMIKMHKTAYGRHLVGGQCGTPPYLHPRIIRNKLYGSEVDLFAMALTMLNVRFPSAKDALSEARLSFKRRHSKNGIQTTFIIPEDCKESWETPAGNYLKNLINITLERPGLSEGARQDLIRMKEALSDAKGEDGELLSFINSAINTSFTSQQDYQEGLKKLSQHPFLQESTL